MPRQFLDLHPLSENLPFLTKTDRVEAERLLRRAEFCSLRGGKLRPDEAREIRLLIERAERNAEAAIFIDEGR